MPEGERETIRRGIPVPSGGRDAEAPALVERVGSWRWIGAALLGLALLHGSLLAARAASRQTGESLLSVVGFVAIELLLLLPLLPAAREQARRCRWPDDGRWLRLLVQGALALVVVATYRGTVLSAVLLVELGEVPLDQLAGWWRHAGPWQIQADLLVYGGVGAWLAVLPDATRAGGRTGSPGTEETNRGPGGTRHGASSFRSVVFGPDATPAAQRLTVRSGGCVHVVPAEEIRWIEGAGTYVRIHTSERSYLLRDTLRSLTLRLEPSGFVRVHRSALLNLRHLRRLEPASGGRWTARLANGAAVPVAASRTERLEAALGDTLGG